MLKSYAIRIKLAGGTGIITYTEGVVDSHIETMLKATVDNIVRLDGTEITVEAMIGCKYITANYRFRMKGSA